MTPDQKALTQAKPKNIGGVMFRCYHVGILRYAWATDDGRAWVKSNYNRMTYQATVDGVPIKNAALQSKRFRSLEAAMVAAVKGAACQTPKPDPTTPAQ